METLIESIRAAIASDASDDVRATGARACRTILAALDTKPGEAMTLAGPVTSTADASSPAAQIANMLGALRGIPAEQLLDLAIARLRAVLPAEMEQPKVAPPKFHIVQLPKRGPR